MVAWKLTRWGAAAVAGLGVLYLVGALPTFSGGDGGVVGQGASCSGNLGGGKPRLAVAESPAQLQELASLEWPESAGALTSIDMDRDVAAGFYVSSREWPVVKRIERLRDEMRVTIGWRTPDPGVFDDDCVHQVYTIMRAQRDETVVAWAVVDEGGTELARTQRFGARWVSSTIPVWNYPSVAQGRTLAVGEWQAGPDEGHRLIFATSRRDLDLLAELLPEQSRLLTGVDPGEYMVIALLQGPAGLSEGNQVVIESVEVFDPAEAGAPAKLRLRLRWQRPVIVRGEHSFEGPWEPSYHVIAVPISAVPPGSIELSARGAALREDQFGPFEPVPSIP
jgi:hypothetical protein